MYDEQNIDPIINTHTYKTYIIDNVLNVFNTLMMIEELYI